MITLTHDEEKQFKDSEDCFGKMYDDKESDCLNCEQGKNCKSLFNKEDYQTPSGTKKTKGAAKVTREIVTEIFNRVIGENSDYEIKVIAAANHDKLYIDGDYIGKATVTALYLEDNDPIKYTDLTMEDVESIFQAIALGEEAEDKVTEAKDEPAVEFVRVDSPSTATETSTTLYSISDIKTMTVAEFLRLILD